MKPLYYYKLIEGDALDVLEEKTFWSYQCITDIQFKQLILNHISRLRSAVNPDADKIINIQTLVKSLNQDGFFPIVFNGVADSLFFEDVKSISDIFGDVEDLNS